MAPIPEENAQNMENHVYTATEKTISKYVVAEKRYRKKVHEIKQTETDCE